MERGSWFRFGLSPALVVAGCAGDGGTSMGATGGMTGSGGQAATGEYGLYVNATTVGEVTDYSAVVASASDGALAIVAMVVDAAGAEGYTEVFVSPYPEPGTYDCTTDGAYIATLQLCCPFVYDTRNEPHDVCTITITEAGTAPGSDVAGTFEGIAHDENGGRMFLRDGRFRARLAE